MEYLDKDLGRKLVNRDMMARLSMRYGQRIVWMHPKYIK